VTVSAPPPIKPSCMIIIPLPNAKVRGLLDIRGNSSRNGPSVILVEVKIDDRAWTKATGTRNWSYEVETKPLGNGRHNIQARAFDGVNYSESASVNITVDNQPPSSRGLIPGFGAAAAVLALVGLASIRRKVKARFPG